MTITRTRDVPPLKTLLFDLDGTLLDIDMPGFLRAYHSLAGRRFVRPVDLPHVTSAMAAAGRKMIAHRAGGRTLDRVFLEAFSPAIKRHPNEVWAILMAFHCAEFEQLRRLTAPRPAARPLLEQAASLGYELVLATNPVFFLEAIRARIRWAGLEGIPFTLITAAETMSSAKPHLSYFTQTLRILGRRADECLMIGDDPDLDLPARRAGIGTWLVIPEPEEPCAVAGADVRGTLEELSAWLLERGPVDCGSPARGRDVERVQSPRGEAIRESDLTVGPVASLVAPADLRRAARHSPTAFQAVQELMQEINGDFEATEDVPIERTCMLRSVIRDGRMTPRAGVWLWVRIMRALADLHAANSVLGCISPDSIIVEGETSVRISNALPCRDEYRAPETRKGLPPDIQADIYSMGVVLFELVTGTPEHLGKRRPAEVQSDIPPWLDELIMRCTEKELSRRYRTTDDVAAVLMRLKRTVPGPGKA